MPSPKLKLTLPLACLTALGLLAAPNRAQACGGTFCDNLPQPMPVDQSGEDILFVLDGQEVEVHIRIQYEGDAERFAWVVPLQGIPEVSVGSEPLFQALSQTTAPSWDVSTQYDCDEDRPGWGAEDSGGFSPSLDIGNDTDGGGPDVVLEETVGAFEVLVLQGGTAQEVVDFLTLNDYAQDPAAVPILQQYLDEDFLFAAVKLTAGAAVEEIHPLSFRFPGTEPCVPIRLTRIAAVDDMGIRTYFLAEDRWAPSNYAHAVLNPVAYDWDSAGADAYLELLSLAVDEAGGRAFVTEYAGPSSAVPDGALFRDSWDEAAFIGVDPIQAIDLIAQQQLNTHPLIRSLLMQFIPPPMDVDAQDFWNNIEFYQDQIDLNAWDDVEFAAAILERIIEPGLHASDLLGLWPKLTRLNTTMSPFEMNVDPVFHPNADLEDVSDPDRVTVEQILCGGDAVYHVDLDGDDTPVCVPEVSSYPDFAGQMPRLLRSEQIPMMGPPQVSTDNRETILQVHAAYEEGVACTPIEVADTGDSEGDGDPGGEDESTGTGPNYDLPYDVSCGCSTERGAAPVGVGLGLLVLALIGPWRRRD